MTWFKVDDRFPESDKVIELTLRPEGLAALGLWTLCGAWSAGRGNGGRITESVVRRFRGTKRHVAALVAVGLWDPSDDEWQFHDWSDYNESAETAEAVKAAEREAGRRGNHERWHVKRNVVVASCPYCVGTPNESESGGDRVPDIQPESGAIPPGPVPDPDPDQTDVTHPDTASHELNASASDDDPIEVVKRERKITNLPRIRRAFGALVDGEASDGEVLDLAAAVLDRSAKFVDFPEAYIEKAVKESRSEVAAYAAEVRARAPRVVAA